tara:strand:- start:22 stop:318 length:297 start_codon:yes stop_codon:yes gene_type:complete
MRAKKSSGTGSFLRTLQRGSMARRDGADVAMSALGFIAEGSGSVEELVDRMGGGIAAVLKVTRDLEKDGLIEFADEKQDRMKLSDKGRQLYQRRKALL